MNKTIIKACRQVVADACMLELSLKALKEEAKKANLDVIKISSLIAKHAQFSDKLNQLAQKYLQNSDKS